MQKRVLVRISWEDFWKNLRPHGTYLGFPKLVILVTYWMKYFTMKVVLAVWTLAKKLNSVHMLLEILRNLQKYGPARLCQKVAWKSKFLEHFHLWWKCNFCFEKFSILGCCFCQQPQIFSKSHKISHIWQHLLSGNTTCHIQIHVKFWSLYITTTKLHEFKVVTDELAGS